MSRIRVVEVRVQPVLMWEDDDEDLTPLPLEDPMSIPGKEWATYCSVRFPKEIKAYEDGLRERDLVPQPNRATRRKKAARKRTKRPAAKTAK